MKIIKTNNYFIDMIKKESKNSNSKGSKYDKEGKGFEDAFCLFINKKTKNDLEKELLKEFENFFKKKIKNCEVLRKKNDGNQTNCKGDIILIFEDNTSIYVSLKNTGACQVAGGEYCINTIKNYFNDNTFFKHFLNFHNLKYRSSFLKEKHSESYEYLCNYWGNINNKKLLEMITMGVNKQYKPNYILFLNKNNGDLFISKIDEYIDFIIKYGANGTFNSHSIITASSRGVFQVKLRNPLRLRNRDFLIKDFNNSKKEVSNNEF